MYVSVLLILVSQLIALYGIEKSTEYAVADEGSRKAASVERSSAL